MKRNFSRFCLLLTLMLMLAVTSCKYDRNQPGYAYMPDMYYSTPYDPYTSNPILKDSVTMQVPVPGTIARGHTPYPYKAKSFEDQKRAGEELINPIPPDPGSLAIGKEQYTVYCSICHGVLGKGDGHLYQIGKFTAKPAVLTDSLVQAKKDGEIFHVITVGSLSGLMGAHGPQITPENRWNIINYVRSLAKQQSQ